jgi:hypothetical protein
MSEIDFGTSNIPKGTSEVVKAMPDISKGMLGSSKSHVKDTFCNLLHRKKKGKNGFRLVVVHFLII